MPISHLLLTLLVVLIWGVNFIFLKLGLKEIPPFLLCTLRFILASIPAIFFIKPPTISFFIVAAYGIITFAMQFSLLFLGMHVGIGAGMASILMQTQVFFSIFFAAFFLKEVPRSWQISGALVSFLGIGLIGLHVDHETSFEGFILILAAAASWGLGSLITKKIQHVNMISLVVWGSFSAILPMGVLSLFLEGPTQILFSYHHLTAMGVWSLLYIVYISTWVGYGIWNWLLSRYPVSVIVPFSLLTPIVGVISSILFLGEPFQPWKCAAGLLIISGLCINLLGARLFVSQRQ